MSHQEIQTYLDTFPFFFFYKYLIFFFFNKKGRHFSMNGLRQPHHGQRKQDKQKVKFVFPDL